MDLPALGDCNNPYTDPLKHSFCTSPALQCHSWDSGCTQRRGSGGCADFPKKIPRPPPSRSRSPHSAFLCPGAALVREGRGSEHFPGSLVTLRACHSVTRDSRHTAISRVDTAAGSALRGGFPEMRCDTCLGIGRIWTLRR